MHACPSDGARDIKSFVVCQAPTKCRAKDRDWFSTLCGGVCIVCMLQELVVKQRTRDLRRSLEDKQAKGRAVLQHLRRLNRAEAGRISLLSKKRVMLTVRGADC